MKKRVTITELVVAFILVLALSAVPLAAQQRDDSANSPAKVKSGKDLKVAITRVDQLFANAYAKHHQGSITVGVVSGDKLIWTKSYGLADMENHVPATKDSTYRIGSITKQLTATMLLQLVEQGKVHLSDPVKKYYPEIEQVRNPYSYAQPVTLLQLATHTSGLSAEPGNVKKFTTGPVADWDKILLSALPNLSFKYEPGTRFYYSNIGYAILGEALSRAAGEPYTEYVTKHILEPLGMTHSAFEQNDEMLRTLTKGYVLEGSSGNPAPAAAELHNGRGYKVPNGALFSTIEDLARFVSFEMGYGPENVLPRSVEADDFARSYSANGDLTSGYGIGFEIVREGDAVMAGHGGAVTGYLANAFFNPSAHIGVIWMSNAFDGEVYTDQLTLAAIKMLLQ